MNLLGVVAYVDLGLHEVAFYLVEFLNEGVLIHILKRNLGMKVIIILIIKNLHTHIASAGNAVSFLKLSYI
ncbi:hypothetical protein BGC33_09340 [Bathymodiolus thermophilus thioautotrophic gill symbiont]|uniref:Uncharacterized protein n=1 Tax=Bathymodiolus thermophilus thioautotrophic gill symbiont TaxID=2360 RepID=A0A1J5UIJ0_9GAMM|nr:hypothetical protein BGC33_09340 [Bathymodiolus thermophilus thioautotrophic gill symbiont]